jgi:predicted transposase/invertase (TIGR01784 family)
MTELKHKLTDDVLFKLLFVKYPDTLLKRLVAALLRIRVEAIGEDFRVVNSDMPPNALGEKYCCLDINMTVNGQRVDLEIQVEDQGNYRERSLYYWAREYSSALPEGKDYSKLPRTIVISILGFPLFRCGEFHSEFELLEVRRHERLTDKLALHYFELPKLPVVTDAGDELKLWLALFNAKSEEELENLVAIGGDIMVQAVEAYRHVSASDEFKELERLRSKARHDEAQALMYERCTIAKRMIARGTSIEDIAADTGLTVDDVLRLK